MRPAQLRMGASMTGFAASIGRLTTTDGPPPRALLWSIWAGCIGFVIILALAAVFDRTILWLHLFQAFEYLAVMALAARGSRWGYFLGVSIAAFWNYGAMFVNQFFRNGVRAIGQSFDAHRL